MSVGTAQGAKEAGTTGSHVRFPSDSKLATMYSPPPETPAGALFQALYDYNSTDPSDLPFKANDIIRVLEEGAADPA